MERPLTKDIKPDGTVLTLAEYERLGGYEALRAALRQDPKQLLQTVTQSNLRGRGGAGFATGLKWSFVPMGPNAPRPKYVVANADEMEPGTFKDRLLLEGNPHQFIEGMILAAYTIQADISYIFLRWAYKLAEQRLRQALAEAHAAGYLGKNILGSGWGLEMHLHVSAGRYMCGEETGLMNSLEGNRAIPRSRPPFPQVSGLWGKPTIVNNVETFSNIPHIIRNGAEWFQKLSLSKDGGTKLYGVSGRVKRPGIWELPMGTTMGEIFFDHAGGMRDGYQARAVIPGGASTEYLPIMPDLKMDFDTVQKAGSRLGTGTMIVLDDRTCPIAMTHNLEVFFARESCGWCTPCREGLPWTARLLEAIENGTGRLEDMHRLRLHTKHLGMGRTFCALAPGAMEPLASALTMFADDFLRHINERRCPWKQ